MTDTCTYCGDAATDRDHLIPQSHSATGVSSFARHLWVWACGECNILLSDRPLFTVEERGAFLLNRIPERYEKLLNSPVWDDDEIDELGPSLRNTIIEGERKKRWVADRVRFLTKWYL